MLPRRKRCVCQFLKHVCMKKILYFILLFLFVFDLSSQSSNTVAQLPTFNAKKGVNIASWLSQSRQRGERRKNFFTRDDVKDIAALGFDHVRIPIDEEQMFSKEGEKEIEAFGLLHDAIGWCREFNLKVIVDMHILRSHFFNAAVRPLFTEVAAQEQFYNCWRLISGELNKYPNEMLAYELMNEPVADDSEMWNIIAIRCTEEIRKLEPYRTIVIGSNGWQTYACVKELRLPPNDKNIIISFHYYNPDALTHYTASWANYRTYTGPVHYPGIVATAEEIAKLPQEQQEKYGHLSSLVFNREVIEKHFQEVADEAKKWGLTVYCGEFGCLAAAPEADRDRWYADMGSLFKQFDFGFGHWDFKGNGFGIKRNGEWMWTIIEPLTGKTKLE